MGLLANAETPAIARTPRLLAEVESSLPAGFPEEVAAPVLRGLERAAGLLAG